jgi:hypothetical protein
MILYSFICFYETSMEVGFMTMDAMCEFLFLEQNCFQS